jgi:hypothetical protein
MSKTPEVPTNFLRLFAGVIPRFLRHPNVKKGEGTLPSLSFSLLLIRSLS